MGDEENVLITSMHIRREKAKQMSPTKSVQNSLHPEMFQSAMSDMDAFHSCYDKRELSFSTIKMASNE